MTSDACTNCESSPAADYGGRSPTQEYPVHKQDGRPCDCFTQPTQPEMMYVQQKMREPIRPPTKRCKPKGRQDFITMYNEAYRNKSQPSRLSIIKAADSLKAPDVPLAGDTTYADAYKDLGVNETMQPILPEKHRIMGCGPFSSETTNKHDFPPQPYSKMDPVLPEPALAPVDEPINAVSTMEASYQPPDRSKFQPASPCLPTTAFKRTKDPMEDSSTMKDSYRPMPPQDTKICIPERTPNPTDNFTGETTYNSCFKPANENCARDPIMPPPTANIINFFSNDFDDLTIYREDYRNKSGQKCRLGLIIREPTLKIPDEPFLHNSTQKIDYHSWGRVPVVQKIVPPRSHTLGRGLMDFTTTHKNDFNPVDPAYGRRGPFTPDNKCSWAPAGLQTGNTTMADSYKLPDMTGFIPAVSCKRGERCRAKLKPISGNTTQKVDYQTWPLAEKFDMPWADKAPYQYPEKKFEGDTTYTSSFPAPGYWVVNPIKEERKLCGVVTGCYCKFPGECCHSVANTAGQSDNPPPAVVLSS